MNIDINNADAAAVAYRLSKVGKTYRKNGHDILAVRDIDLSIQDGEWLAIQGKTGHGKTTLLQLLGGLDRPTAGSIAFAGQDLATAPEARVRKVRAGSFGFIFQTFNLVPTLTAHENVEAALIPLGVHHTQRHKQVEQALDSVGLADGPSTCRPNCPAASSSGSRSPVPWSNSPGCYWPTSRQETWTRTPGMRSSACSRGCGGSAG
jgi:ABC-type lipoprotein export system ATPase subunit